MGFIEEKTLRPFCILFLVNITVVFANQKRNTHLIYSHFPKTVA